MTGKTLIALAAILCAVVPGRAGDRQDEASSGGQRRFTVGLGVKASTLGIGAEGAIPVMRRANVRVGFTLFNYDRTVDRDGIDYAGTLGLRSVQALFDFFPVSSFHVSPGVLIYNGNNFSARPSVPLGKTFDIGTGSYITDPANPLGGTAKLDFGKTAPMIVIGWGNLVPRKKHFSFSTEFGVAYHGAPQARVNFSGGLCDPSGANCRSISSDPTVQRNIQSEVNKLNRDASPYKVFPIISIGFGYKF